MILNPASSGGYASVPAILLVILALLPRQLSAQPDNLTLLMYNARSAGDSVMAAYSTGDTVCLVVAPHDAAWLVERGVLQAAETHGVTVLPCADRNDSGISIAVTSVGIEYLLIDDPDSVRRIASLELATTYGIRSAAGNSRKRIGRTFSLIRSDTVSVDETSSLETSGYAFARGTLPPRNSSGFWSKIIEPAVVLGASVVMVILLFTVRSQ